MKNGKKVLLSLLASACVTTVAGCGGDGAPTYQITAEVSNSEYGMITGGGKYKDGSKVTFKIYPNVGCKPANDPQNNIQPIVFVRNGETEASNVNSNSYLREIRNDAGKVTHYEYEIEVNAGIENPELNNIGKYTAQFACDVNTAEDLENSSRAEYIVKFIVVDNFNEIDDLVPSQTVKSGDKVKAISYVDDVEGRLEWYTDKNNGSIYDFNSVVTGDMTLYGKIVDTSAKDAVKNAIDNFKSSSLFTFKLGKDNEVVSANVKNYDKVADGKMRFEYYDSTMTDPNFIIENNIYYEYNDKVYYKLLLKNSGFDAFDLVDVNKFFKHVDIDFSETSKFSFEKVKVEGVTYKEDVVIGKDNKDNDIIVKCIKYVVKKQKEDQSLEDFMTLYINNGVLYKTVDASGISNVIYYPSSIGTIDPGESIRDLLLIRLKSTTDVKLNEELTKINSKFETILKLRPSKGETLASLLNEDKVKDILKLYDYSVKDGANVVNPNTVFINTNKEFDIVTGVTYKQVSDAIEKLKTGGYKITTLGILFEKEYTEEYLVSGNVNIFEMENKPSGMVRATWNSLVNLEKLLEIDYDNFSYDDESKEYFFYDKNDKVPFVSLKLDSNGRISTVVYYEKDGSKVTTYTSTFDYSLNEYLTALDSVKNGKYSISDGTSSYSELEGLDLVVAQTRPSDLTADSLWNILQELDDLANNEKYTLASSNNVYSFTNVEDEDVIYEVTISNNMIESIKQGETTYTFDHSIKES